MGRARQDGPTTFRRFTKMLRVYFDFMRSRSSGPFSHLDQFAAPGLPRAPRKGVFALIALVGLATPPAARTCRAEAEPPSTQSATPDTVYRDEVRPFLVRHCIGCHGPEKPKGKRRLDRLSPNFVDRESRETWLAVLERVEAGEMPPESKPRPPEQEDTT